ncbi:MAG: 50S ribosomal protein L29 [Proteobacteria bacterium]|jgi:large subunit ribosomal protein L29|nr:50S ribosomal protein L29 [Pseudomonadota bacterium]MDA0873165.1 50S ribosomal protein L29 [Pseudomonadota bacterium]MDA1133302.1 50S ribosomal protein L29 [Pseudomonadota bacterium]
MKAEELRKKSAEDLDKELIELRKAQFNARMQVSTQQSNKTDQLGKLKKDIARVKTIISEKVKESL